MCLVTYFSVPQAVLTDRRVISSAAVAAVEHDDGSAGSILQD